MKIYRLFLLGFMTVSWLFLSGFTTPVADNSLKQRPVAESPKTGQHDDKTEQIDIGPAKPLDLSVPFKEIKNGDNSGVKTAPDKTDQNGTPNLFTTEPKKTTRPLQLKGGWVMSPEPEVEKSKSVDGAGIVINVKP